MEKSLGQKSIKQASGARLGVFQVMQVFLGPGILGWALLCLEPMRETAPHRLVIWLEGWHVQFCSWCSSLLSLHSGLKTCHKFLDTPPIIIVSIIPCLLRMGWSCDSLLKSEIEQKWQCASKDRLKKKDRAPTCLTILPVLPTPLALGTQSPCVRKPKTHVDALVKVTARVPSDSEHQLPVPQMSNFSDAPNPSLQASHPADAKQSRGELSPLSPDQEV